MIEFREIKLDEKYKRYDVICKGHFAGNIFFNGFSKIYCLNTLDANINLSPENLREIADFIDKILIKVKE